MSLKIDKPDIRSKKIKYAVERQNVLNRLFAILGITEENRICFLDELDADIDKQNQIIALVPDIKLYFRCSSWSYFAKPDRVEKKYLSLAKTLIREMEHIITAITEKTPDKKLRYGFRVV